MSGEGWYTQIDGVIRGPISTGQLLELHSNGEIGATTRVSRNKTDWMEAGLLPGLNSLVASSDASTPTLSNPSSLNPPPDPTPQGTQRFDGKSSGDRSAPDRGTLERAGHEQVASASIVALRDPSSFPPPPPLPLQTPTQAIQSLAIKHRTFTIRILILWVVGTASMIAFWPMAIAFCLIRGWLTFGMATDLSLGLPWLWGIGGCMPCYVGDVVMVAVSLIGTKRLQQAGIPVGLFGAKQPLPPLDVPSDGGSQSDQETGSQQPARAVPQTSDWISTGKRQASEIITDLQEMDFRNEIIPIDESNLGRLMKDGVFWFATLLGIVPLMIGTLSETNAQVTAFAMFFAAVWGVIFRSAILRHSASWKFLLPAFFFTGSIGTFAAVLVSAQFLAEDFPDKEGHLSALAKYVLIVGISEEFCKVIPALAYVVWKRRSAHPMTVILIGVFSGLGFAAFENLMYGQLAILGTLLATEARGAAGLVEGVQVAMVMPMLRSLSLVFCHAVWAGIFAYFLAVATVTGRRWGAMFLVGLLLTAVLHGVYDWLCSIQPTMAALTAGISFVLFYGYVAKIRAAIDAAVQGDQPSQLH